MRCRNCQGELPIGATFCPNCGASTADPPPNQPIPPELANPYASPSPTSYGQNAPPPTSYGQNAPPPPLYTNPYSATGPYRTPPTSYPTPDTVNSPPPPPVSNNRRPLITLLGLFLLIVIIGSGVWLYATHQNQSITNTNAGTATIHGTSTPTTTSTVSSLGTPGAYTCVNGNLVISGSTALQPLVTKVTKDYMTQCSSATITVQSGGSSLGRTQVEAGQVGIGDSDTLAGAGQTDLVDHQVNVVIYGVIVNFQADVKNLTTAQIQGIYNGTYTSWKQVGGADLPIVVVSRPDGSGTRATFEQYILGAKETVSGPSHLTSDDTSTVVQEVSQTSGAIGYAVTGQAPAGSGVNIISIDGNEPSTSNVESNAYKFWNVEHMFTKGPPSPIEQAVLDYMDSTQGLVDQAALQFVPLTQMQPSAITAHNAVPQPS